MREARACEPDCKDAKFQQVYFRGTPNAWGTTAMALVDDNLWRTQVTFTDTDDLPNRFKFGVYYHDHRFYVVFGAIFSTDVDYRPFLGDLIRPP